MLDFIKNFRADEDGAVTVDWVVLTAAIVGMGIAVLAAVRGGAEDMGDNIATQLATPVPTLDFTPE
jgi:Flp pilus assembly pilin Flp